MRVYTHQTGATLSAIFFEQGRQDFLRIFRFKLIALDECIRLLQYARLPSYRSFLAFT